MKTERNTIYKNRQTGELTDSHDTAMFWYRLGYQIEIYRDGKMILALEM